MILLYFAFDKTVRSAKMREEEQWRLGYSMGDDARRCAHKRDALAKLCSVKRL